MIKKVFTGLRARLFLLILLVIMPIVGTEWYAANQNRTSLKQEQQRGLHQFVHLAAANQAAVFNGARQLITTLAYHQEAHFDDMSFCNLQMASILIQNVQYINLGYAGKDGEVICSSLPVQNSLNISNKSYFVKSMTREEFAISEFEIEPLSQKMTVVLSHPVHLKMQPMGVIFAAIDLEYLFSLSQQIEIPDGAEVTLIDQYGTVLMSNLYPEKIGHSLQNFSLWQIIQQSEKSGEGEVASFTGGQDFYAFTELRPEGALLGYLVITIPDHYIYRTANSALQSQMLTLIGVTLLALFFLNISVNHFFFRLTALLAVVRQLTQGKLSARSGLPPASDELGELIQTFDQMASSLEENQQSLLRAEANQLSVETRLADILRNVNEAIISCDEHLRILVFNKSAEKMFGFPAEEMIGQNVAVVLKNTPLFTLLKQQTVLETSNLSTTANRLESTLMHKDGSEFIAEAGLSILIEQGALILTLSLVDITNRKKMEKALTQSSENMRTVLQNMPIMLNAFDEHFNIVAWNHECELVTGYKAEEVIGNPNIMRQLFPDPEYLLEVEQKLRRRTFYRGWEINFTCQNGVVKTISWSNVARYYPVPGWNSWTVGVDVSDRKRAEYLLQQQLQRLDSLHMIDMAISGTMDLRVILSICLAQIQSQLGIDAGLVLLLQPGMYSLEYGASVGFHSSEISQVNTVLGEGIFGQAALQRKPFFCLDVHAQKDSGLELPWLKSEGFNAYYVAPLLAKGEVKGVLAAFHRQSFDADESWKNFLLSLASQAAIAIDNAALFEDLARSNLELSQAYDETIEGWAHTLELRDRETEGHARRVVDMTMQLATAMGISTEEIVHVRRGAMLHDIGKMGIPDAILFKPGKLNPEEWKIMRMHPVHAYNLLSAISFLRPAVDIPYGHHEHWDGNGYPLGLSGESIPLAARIFAVVDVWDALSYERVYHPAWSSQDVMEYIEALAGKQFDPEVVRVFLSILRSRTQTD